MIHRSLAIAIRTFAETILPAACPTCGGPLGRHAGGVCLSCWEEAAALGPAGVMLASPGLDSLTAMGSYEGRLRQIIRCLKFSDLPGVAVPLGDRLAAAVGHLTERIDLVAPVPLHRLRRWRRGYNQSELIARRIAGALDRPLAPRALVRWRATASQRGRSRRDRAANVRGAFRTGTTSDDLSGLGILLVDDVVTTGATMAECARVLYGAGAAAVHAAAAARTISRIDT